MEKDEEQIIRDAKKNIGKLNGVLEKQFGEVQKMMSSLRNEPTVVERKSKNGKIISLLSDFSVKVQCENKDKAKKYFDTL